MGGKDAEECYLFGCIPGGNCWPQELDTGIHYAECV